ncbi:hypothetical protein CJU89_0121 [Yarrowia sp. B02]|nr:hypothetical protein CJU89_0121 [Yarrowia sp. B02]
MTTFKISKYIYLHKNTPTPQGLVSSGIDRDASEWTKYPNSPLQLIMDTTATGGAKITLTYRGSTLEFLDTQEIDDKFGSMYGKNNPPLVAICKQRGIGFKYLVRRFHTMTYRFQIKFASEDEFERAVNILSKAGVCIKGRPNPPVEDIQSAFKDFNPESLWVAEDDPDMTKIDPMLMSQPTFSQPSFTQATSHTLVDTPGSSQAFEPKMSQSYQPKLSQSSYQRFSETSTWKRPADDISSLEASPVNSPPNSPKKSWKQHFTPQDPGIRRSNGMVSRGTQTEDPEWLTDSKAMEQHIVDVVQSLLFDTYVARIKELMRAENVLG